MKKSKRTLIVVTALSMIMSTAGNITLSYAQTSGEGDVYIPIDMSGMYNANRIYSSYEDYHAGLAGDSGAFRYNEFIGMVDSEGNSKWKNEWTSGMTDNTLLHDGVEFLMRVVDCGNGDTKSQNCLFLNNSTDEYTYIDVDDDNYISIELLANTDKKLATGMSNRYIGIKLNYVDGTHDVAEIPISYFVSEGTRPVVCLSDLRDASLAQISHLTVDVNYYKKLDSFQILNERYVFDKESDGSYKKDANGDYITAAHSGATRKARSHSAAVYAMTLVQNEEKTQEVIKEEAKKLYSEIYNDIEALGEITYDKKSDLDAIAEKINKIIALELPVTKTEVANLDVYEAALARWEELRIEKIINDISDMITALGDIDSLTIEKEQDILDITNAIDAAIAEGVRINSDTVANYSDYERALVKLDELRIEKKKQDIIDAITALGDVEELTSADLERIEAIQTMMDNAKKEGIEISSATIPNFADFKRAEEIVKADVPYGDVVDLSDYYNTADIYTTDLSHNGAAGYAGSFSYNWMINNIAWEEEWGSNVDNTFVMDGIKFKLRVVDYMKDTQACIFKNKDTGSAFSKIDVTDGNYTNVHILANSDMSWPTGGFKRLGIKVNYDDGTYELIDFASSYNKGKNIAFGVDNIEVGAVLQMPYIVNADYFDGKTILMEMTNAECTEKTDISVYDMSGNFEIEEIKKEENLIYLTMKNELKNDSVYTVSVIPSVLVGSAKQYGQSASYSFKSPQGEYGVSEVNFGMQDRKLSAEFTLYNNTNTRRQALIVCNISKEDKIMETIVKSVTLDKNSQNVFELSTSIIYDNSFFVKAFVLNSWQDRRAFCNNLFTY